MSGGRRSAPAPRSERSPSPVPQRKSWRRSCFQAPRAPLRVPFPLPRRLRPGGSSRRPDPANFPSSRGASFRSAPRGSARDVSAPPRPPEPLRGDAGATGECAAQRPRLGPRAPGAAAVRPSRAASWGPRAPDTRGPPRGPGAVTGTRSPRRSSPAGTRTRAPRTRGPRGPRLGAAAAGGERAAAGEGPGVPAGGARAGRARGGRRGQHPSSGRGRGAGGVGRGPGGGGAGRGAGPSSARR